MPASDEPYLLPVFPLQHVVLFPETRCPLHVFEPRYRQMTEAALTGERRIGMIAVPPEHVAEMAGDPPLFGVGCEGRIADATRLADGRFQLLLVGTHRFRILEEPKRPAEQLYRTALVQPLHERLDSDARLRVAALRARAIELLSAWYGRVAQGEPRLEPERFSAADDGTLVNALCQHLDLTVAEKQALLEARDVAERYRGLADILQFRLAELAAALGPASRQLH